jgi:hypothetical protein
MSGSLVYDRRSVKEFFDIPRIVDISMRTASRRLGTLLTMIIEASIADRKSLATHPVKKILHLLVREHIP